ncbi:hypothetical protein [Bacillus sp. SM2101]|uniref:hypothetical protein n=1 Tax=Bacillus sp. SM2101 TaxID=2805366 RepID=UPI001BDDD088|nr:hypothetical protein [Bacillus sp. SM2101]
MATFTLSASKNGDDEIKFSVKNTGDSRAQFHLAVLPAPGLSSEMRQTYIFDDFVYIDPGETVTETVGISIYSEFKVQITKYPGKSYAEKLSKILGFKISLPETHTHFYDLGDELEDDLNRWLWTAGLGFALYKRSGWGLLIALAMGAADIIYEIYDDDKPDPVRGNYEVARLWQEGNKIKGELKVYSTDASIGLMWDSGPRTVQEYFTF